MSGTLFLLPWHLGDRRDVTVGAVAEARRLRVLLVEDEAAARRELAAVGADVSSKVFVTVPVRRSRAVLAAALKALSAGDAGLLSSSGTPCFVDPGAWLVADLRARGVPVRARGGASSLAALLSLSGYDMILSPPSRGFSFRFFDHPRRAPELREALSRREPLIVFLNRGVFAACLEAVAGAAPARRVTAFFDLTKPRLPALPLAGEVVTRTASAWRREAARLPWDKIGDVALLVHPASGRWTRRSEP